MEKPPQATSMDLIRQVESMGLASNSTMTCSVCKAVFPNQYDNCPKCKLS